MQLRYKTEHRVNAARKFTAQNSGSMSEPGRQYSACADNFLDRNRMCGAIQLKSFILQVAVNTGSLSGQMVKELDVAGRVVVRWHIPTSSYRGVHFARRSVMSNVDR